MFTANIINFIKSEQYSLFVVFALILASLFAYFTTKIFIKSKEKRNDIVKNIKRSFKVDRKKNKRKNQ